MIAYAAAVALWIAAVITLGVSAIGFLESTGLLIVSAVLSGLAVAASIGAVVLGSRR